MLSFHLGHYSTNSNQNVLCPNNPNIQIKLNNNQFIINHNNNFIGLNHTQTRVHKREKKYTFSAEEPVRTKVEKTGSGYLVWGSQHSIVAPIGRQKRGTHSESGNDS